ncbi:LURP-one-related/scramblase family protein [Streptococcus oricebi]|uniref:UDP-N-acetylenolpyruvoylglucosamine reductase n=1 Tax=Streptococcus oricebi TaxID=1547447 RepID=A0ABS5B2E8_9STRE|nr:LURP-one-related family protein [Streptococcus oricebi]MBP2622851.1 UDP-N-acetylenolpyruvoylglucosamine reductase [Streptococcus oricebi]
MKSYHVKQKVRLGGERFEIFDAANRLAYQAAGSFLKIPKTFKISRSDGSEVASIKKQLLTFLPGFEVVLAKGSRFRIKKKWTFFRDRYELTDFDLTVQGNFWDLKFKLVDNQSQLVAEIDKELFHLSSHYNITIFDEAYEELVISLVVAIDYVEAMEDAANSKNH